ncbi:winged helix-turn-helix transcriptional regulator [Levilactobacillus parabrevis]|uniref:winged helix-turn-helix transcriptional regulator n=1 Tax=Levilactobacillus parabrevis TaxID=357278 RepID=UPI0021A6FF7F|nr:helix-turn-helix domain-containing protein [Levilactobacillus parabrevis]MCT4487944.1 transcriptional regulator [Levilactobacillus parabrevis]MCT4490213.1 transcriptional regulator [Levilactobacillus parabrevis]
MKKSYNNGVEATLGVISGKWKPQLLCHLGNRPQRTCDLRQELPAISQKVLTQQLRELEDDGIVKRLVYGNRAPFKVVYELTDLGRSLGQILVQMSLWGEQWASQVPEMEIQNDHDGFAKLLRN